MNALSEAERYLLDAVRRGDEQGWPQLVDRYQGRLLAFARSRVRNASDAEDRVQEAFIGLLRGLEKFRGECSLETYLFSILRRRIIDSHRGKANGLCLLRDTLRADTDDNDLLNIVKQTRSNIPAVTHVDGSGRLQTVSRKDNPLYWRLIKEFEAITGVPVLLNTSFNENEPIVNTPDEALDCYLRTRMDTLVLGSFLIQRD